MREQSVRQIKGRRLACSTIVLFLSALALPAQTLDQAEQLWKARRFNGRPFISSTMPMLIVMAIHIAPSRVSGMRIWGGCSNLPMLILIRIAVIW